MSSERTVQRGICWQGRRQRDLSLNAVDRVKLDAQIEELERLRDLAGILAAPHETLPALDRAGDELCVIELELTAGHWKDPAPLLPRAGALDS